MNCKMLLAQTKLSLGNRSEAKEDFDDLFKKRPVESEMGLGSEWERGTSQPPVPPPVHGC